MKMKYLLVGIVTIVVALHVSAWAAEPWSHADEMQWDNVGANGPGTSTKVLLTKENGMIDDRVRAMWLVKVDPGGDYTTTAIPEEDRAFFITRGRGVFALGDQQINARPGDAFGVPAGLKHGLKNAGAEPVEMIVFAATLPAPNSELRPLIGRADEMEWQPNSTHGPGCAAKMLLGRGFSAAIRGLWIMKVDAGGLNFVHSGGEHQLFYIWQAPEPDRTPRDDRTHGARFILKDKIVQTRAGDAFYAAGAPPRDEHGLINESNDTPLFYVAIGVPVPGAGGAGGRRGQSQGGGARQRLDIQ